MIVLNIVYYTYFVEDESFEVESFAIFKVRLQQFVDVLQCGFILFELHAADGSSKQQGDIVFLFVDGFGVDGSGVLEVAHQS